LYEEAHLSLHEPPSWGGAAGGVHGLAAVEVCPGWHGGGVGFSSFGGVAGGVHGLSAVETCPGWHGGGVSPVGGGLVGGVDGGVHGAAAVETCPGWHGGGVSPVGGGLVGGVDGGVHGAAAVDVVPGGQGGRHGAPVAGLQGDCSPAGAPAVCAYMSDGVRPNASVKPSMAIHATNGFTCRIWMGTDLDCRSCILSPIKTFFTDVSAVLKMACAVVRLKHRYFVFIGSL
jgi:hypothetical protein